MDRNGVIALFLSLNPQMNLCFSTQVSPPQCCGSRKAPHDFTVSHISNGYGVSAIALSPGDSNQHQTVTPKCVNGRLQENANNRIDNSK
jgi:hypothetical protein